MGYFNGCLCHGYARRRCFTDTPVSYKVQAPFARVNNQGSLRRSPTPRYKNCFGAHFTATRCFAGYAFAFSTNALGKCSNHFLCFYTHNCGARAFTNKSCWWSVSCFNKARFDGSANTTTNRANGVYNDSLTPVLNPYA